MSEQRKDATGFLGETLGEGAGREDTQIYSWREGGEVSLAGTLMGIGSLGTSDCPAVRDQGKRDGGSRYGDEVQPGRGHEDKDRGTVTAHAWSLHEGELPSALHSWLGQNWGQSQHYCVKNSPILCVSFPQG